MSKVFRLLQGSALTTNNDRDKNEGVVQPKIGILMANSGHCRGKVFMFP